MNKILILLFIKHFIFDFVWQTPSKIKYKGVYGKPKGIIHSLKHGAGTAIITLNPALGILDTAIHYHVDYVKARWGEKDMSKPKAWHHLGLDQLLHSLTYIMIAGLNV